MPPGRTSKDAVVLLATVLMVAIGALGSGNPPSPGLFEVGEDPTEQWSGTAPPSRWNLETLSSPGVVEAAFVAFSAAHRRPASPGRLQAFQGNVEFARGENKRQTGYTLGLTEYADLTWDEFRSRFLSDPGAMHRSAAAARASVPPAPPAAAPAPDRPESVDWAKKGYVTPVKFQGDCGSCWGFATTAVLEAMMKQKGRGDLVNLSPQELISCEPHHGGAGGCNGGGESIYAAQFVMKHGIMEWDDYPYACTNSTSDACGAALSACHENEQKSIRGLVSGVFDYLRGEDDLVTRLAQRPTAVSVHADRRWQLYTGGTIDHKDCPSAVGTSNHVVAAVGYDPERIAIKNSWGANWGKKGFALVKRGANQCGINNFILNLE